MIAALGDRAQEITAAHSSSGARFRGL